MTRIEREQMIERYLQGELTPAEEQEFFIEAATDKEMRYDLKASQVVESAIKKDRKMAPTSWSDTRAHLVAVLAAQKPNPVQTTAGTRAKGTQASTGLGGKFAMVLVSLISVAALLLSLVAIDRVSEQEQLPTPVQASEPTSAQEHPTVSTVQNVQGDSVQQVTDQTDSNSGKDDGSLMGAKKDVRFSPSQSPTISSEDKNNVERKPEVSPIHRDPVLTDTTNPDKQLQVDVDNSVQ